MSKEVRCYYCKEIISNKEDIQKENISKDKICNRSFHKSKKCYNLFLKKKEVEEKNRQQRQIENEQWDDLYQYIKKNILNYKEEMKLNNHMVMRLQGLRSGKYKPIRNSKVFFSDMGYSYRIILTTFITKKIDILKAIGNKTFDSENKKFDYIMAIVINSINDVYLKYLDKKQEEERFKNIKIDIDTNEMKEYKNKTDLKNNKVANVLKDLF